jgi:hypothetical protein
VTVSPGVTVLQADNGAEASAPSRVRREIIYSRP